MFKMKTIKEQLHESHRENAKLRAMFDKTGADVAYIAMMTDVELDNNDETEEGSYEDEV